MPRRLNGTAAPRTPFNASITTGRAFAAVSLPLAELKGIGKAHDATINDMVMMVVSTALRRYLAVHGAHHLPMAHDLGVAGVLGHG